MKKHYKTESEIRNAIKCHLELKGWVVIRMGAPVFGEKGMGGLLCMKNGITAWVETKSEKGKMSDGQKKFANNVDRGGGLYILARSVEYAIKMLDSIEIAYLNLSGEVAGTIKPDKRMKLICNVKDDKKSDK